MMQARARSQRRADALLLAALVAAAAWTFVSAGASGGSPLPVAELYVVVAAAFVIGRSSATWRPWLVPAIVVCAIVGAALVNRTDLAAGGPLEGPLDYTNATAALYLQGTIAALMVFTLVEGGTWRAVAGGAAVVLAAVTVLAGSQAASLLLILPVVAIVARRHERQVVAALAALLAVALCLSVLMGLVFSPGHRLGGIDASLETALSERRLALWHDALALAAERPVVGVGPGRFQLESPVARSDRDARWAHQGFLQQAAEGGIVALALLVLAFALGFAALWFAPTSAGAVGLGAAALAALGIHACVDYVLHFPVLPFVAAALVGVASSSDSERRGRARDADVSVRPSPSPSRDQQPGGIR